MIKIGILGSTGYVGLELARLLSNHPDAEIVFLDSRSYENKAYSSIFPNMKKIIDIPCVSINLDDDESLKGIDLLFCALPHGLSQKAVQTAYRLGIKVIDMSADFRIKNASVYEEWYNVKHEALPELNEAVYGLCELYREDVKKAEIVANPGCYPTSIILALYPLLKERAVALDSLIVDSKSGVSGAGRNLNDAIIYGQCNESVKAYSIGSHRHTPEIEQELSQAAGESTMLQFTPHLIPMTRGILSTIYFNNKKSLTDKDIEEIYKQYYKDEFFIRLLQIGELPQTKAVYGTNYCDIGFKADKRTNRIVLVSAIDNLVKGAAGQAVQNMNLLFNLKETTGLKLTPVWP